MKSEKLYDVFISYSWKDKTYVSKIQKSIETLGLPFFKIWQNDVKIFRDERKIPLSGDLTEEIIMGLKQSRYLLVIASKNSASSKWVKEEIIQWHNLNKDTNGYITNFNFIILDEVVEWDAENRDFNKIKTTALPKLDQKIFGAMPIWANLQHYCKKGKVETNNSNYEWEIAKIKALLLGKKPDQIIDESSRAKRFFRGVVIATLVVFAGITTYAIIKQREAESEKKNAISQKEIAENNLKSFEIEKFKRDLRNGTLYYEALEFCFAKEAYSSADSAAKKYSSESVVIEHIRELKQKLDSCYKRCIR